MAGLCRTWELECQIGRFVDRDNHRRARESPDNLALAGVCHGHESGQGADHPAQEAPEPGAEVPKRTEY